MWTGKYHTIETVGTITGACAMGKHTGVSGRVIDAGHIDYAYGNIRYATGSTHGRALQ